MPVPLKYSEPGRSSGTVVMDDRLGRHGPLARFIALRREPGVKWMSFQRIADDLTTLTKVRVTRMGVTKWARSMGIPDTKPRGSEAERIAYLAAVDHILHPPRERGSGSPR